MKKENKKTVMLNSFEHPHLNHPLFKAEEILNQVQDDIIMDEALNKNSFRAPLRSGFTLIELLVVVLIIGILAAVAVPQYQKAVWKSRMTQALITGKSFLTAQQVYFLDHGTYATELDSLSFDLSIPKRFYYHGNSDGHLTIQNTKEGIIWDFYPSQINSRGVCVVYNNASKASVLKAACESITQDHNPAKWDSVNKTAYRIYL